MNTPNMTFMKYFYDAAENRSIAKSALLNFVTQPAISQGIHRLEDSLDIKLLKHRKNQFKLTSDGLLLHRRCRELFRLMSDIQSDIAINQKELTGAIRLGISQSLAHSLLPGLLNKFGKTYPKIIPVVKLGTTTTIAEGVKSGQVEFGIVVDHGKLREFAKTSLIRGSYCTAQSIQISTEFKDNYILTDERPETLGLKRIYKRAHKRDLNVSMEVESWGVILRLVEAGLGVGLLPDFMLNCNWSKNPKLKWKKYQDLPYELVSIHSRDTELSRISKLFHQEIVSYYQKTQKNLHS